MCWLGLVDLNILYVFFVGDISLDLFSVRCREDTLSYARGGRKRIINKYWLTNFAWFASAEKRAAYLHQKL